MEVAMHFWKNSIWACTLFLAGCRGGSSTTALIEMPVMTRPIVAVVPVMDKSRHELPWNVSKELTVEIRQRLSQHGRLYLMSEDQVYAMSRRASERPDPFGLETDWIKKGFPQNEFVAFFELIDHKEIPLNEPELLAEESPAELNVSIRVRVFDLRGQEPKIVLQEIVQQSHHIPKQFTQNQSIVLWGDEMFDISPLGIAHEKICQELAGRVEDYILLNCKS
jgi:hypothetical protein